jgi:hypothetical protein
MTDDGFYVLFLLNTKTNRNRIINHRRQARGKEKENIFFDIL